MFLMSQNCLLCDSQITVGAVFGLMVFGLMVFGFEILDKSISCRTLKKKNDEISFIHRFFFFTSLSIVTQTNIYNEPATHTNITLLLTKRNIDFIHGIDCAIFLSHSAASKYRPDDSYISIVSIHSGVFRRKLHQYKYENCTFFLHSLLILSGLKRIYVCVLFLTEWRW